ncbi:hypothetical protein LG3211_3535 [Lysobacter gummosus]|nr:hypothetical protein LG3211_3535 [Lysobacter gummosus]
MLTEPVFGEFHWKAGNREWGIENRKALGESGKWRRTRGGSRAAPTIPDSPFPIPALKQTA